MIYNYSAHDANINALRSLNARAGIMYAEIDDLLNDIDSSESMGDYVGIDDPRRLRIDDLLDRLNELAEEKPFL